MLKLDFDPSLLPDLPGYGYTVAAEGTNDRTAPFRGFYLDELTDDELDAALGRADIRAHTDRTVTDVDVLRERIRANGPTTGNSARGAPRPQAA